MNPDSYLDNLDPKEYIIIKRARVNNLQNLSVAIPRNKMVVVTGLSGSGKSSLAFDTLFAEGQRMYVESLSSYARQFLGRMEKPDVDYIRGVSPAIAIEQRVNTRNPRSTVGTTTEIYDYLKLLFARIGKTISPVSGKEVKRNTVTDVVDTVNALNPGTRIMVACALGARKGRKLTDDLTLLLSKGFARVLLDGEVKFIEDFLRELSAKKKKPQGRIEILIDRSVVAPQDEDAVFRLSDSIQTAFFEGEGECVIYAGGHDPMHFSDRF
ncbi:MAG TPA: excinuclease ABC subunit A, partial [Cyclobacteriaceae bacterium]